MTHNTDKVGLDEKTAHAVYDVLVRECGAREHNRGHFVFGETADHVVEWRFMGKLGFGGKFWRSNGRRDDETWGEVWYVNCYPEDSTPERTAMIEAANRDLMDLLLETAP